MIFKLQGARLLERVENETEVNLLVERIIALLDTIMQPQALPVHAHGEASQQVPMFVQEALQPASPQPTQEASIQVPLSIQEALQPASLQPAQEVQQPTQEARQRNKHNPHKKKCELQ